MLSGVLVERPRPLGVHFFGALGGRIFTASVFRRFACGVGTFWACCGLLLLSTGTPATWKMTKVMMLSVRSDEGMPDEAALIAAARTDPDALSTLYRTHYGAIYGYVYRRLGNANDAGDVVAETFLAMVRHLPRYRWTGVPFRAWLLRLATTQISRWARKRRWFRFWRRVEEAEPVATEVRDSARAEHLREALWTLPVHYQSVLALHYFEDQSLDAIGEILQCPIGTVKSRLSRGRELLKTALTKGEEETTHERRTTSWFAQRAEV